MAWLFADNDPLRIRAWSELVVRDAEKQQAFAPLMYSIDSAGGIKTDKDASKLQGCIKIHSTFQSQSGDRITIANTARVNGRGIHGDGLLRDTGTDLDVDSMDIYIEPVAIQMRTAGLLSEQKVLLNYRKEFRLKLAAWAARKIEEACILTLSGLDSWTGTPLTNWDNNGETSIFRNDIVDFDSNHTVYAGDAADRASIDSGDIVSAELLTKLKTIAMETLDIPLEPLTIDGEDCFILLCSYKAVEQLMFDPDFVQAQRANTYNKSNPLLTGVIGKYGMVYVKPYPKMLLPAANVSRALLLGKDVMHIAKKSDWSWWEGYEDNAERRKVMAISAFLGMAPTVFGSARRNALAVEHYVR